MEWFMTPDGKALVLLSGGQDSTTCLAWALTQFAHVETVGFDYSQRNRVELTMRVEVLSRLRTFSPEWDMRLGEDHVIDLSFLRTLSDSALTSDVAISLMESGLPNTFVPGRNLLFFLTAAALAYRRGITTLIGGMSHADGPGYPDCRESTLNALEQSIRLGMDIPYQIQTPLIHRDKAAIWQFAQDIGGDRLVELVRESTHTCYLGERGVRKDWGYGCGECPACVLRSDGHERFLGKKADATV